MRVSLAITALVFGCALAVQAQQTAPKEHSMTGCLAKGTEANMFRLTNVEKVKIVDIAESTVKLEPHVGHKIDITGTATTGKDPKVHTMRVTAIKMVSATCP